jgi:hypothetical protein
MPSDPASDTRERRIAGYLMNGAIALLGLIVLYLAWALVDRTVLNPPMENLRSEDAPREVIQIDVLNGCGDAGVASKVASFLRARGYDVVEMKNYRTFDVAESLVIDRAGNEENAGKVAYALGVEGRNMITQINQDYYVDVSVVIGKDYRTLRPFH